MSAKFLRFATLFLMIGVMFIASLHSQTVAAPPPNFDEPNVGTQENPFHIASLANLRWLSETPEYWGETGWNAGNQILP